MRLPIIGELLNAAGQEELAVERTEISAGDIERIDEIKSWLKAGKTEQWSEKELERLGYNEYHIDFLMRAATGRREPRLPESLIKAKDERRKQKRRVGYELATLAACAVVLYLFSSLWGGMGVSHISSVLSGAVESALRGVI